MLSSLDATVRVRSRHGVRCVTCSLVNLCQLKSASVFQIFTVPHNNDAFNDKKHSKAFFTKAVPYTYTLFFVPPIRQAQKRYHMPDSLTSL